MPKSTHNQAQYHFYKENTINITFTFHQLAQYEHTQNGEASSFVATLPFLFSLLIGTSTNQ